LSKRYDKTTKRKQNKNKQQKENKTKINNKKENKNKTHHDLLRTYSFDINSPDNNTETYLSLDSLQDHLSIISTGIL